MKTVSILGKEYPIEYTVEAQSMIAERSGGLENVAKTLTNHAAFFLYAMMVGAYNRQRVLAKYSGDEYEGPEPLQEGDISAILFPKDMRTIIQTMTEVIKEASITDVEVAEEKNPKKKEAKPD